MNHAAWRKRRAKQIDCPTIRKLINKYGSHKAALLAKVTFGVISYIVQLMRCQLDLPKDGRWSYIPNTDRKYCISNKGKIRSCANGRAIWKDRVVCFANNGYGQICLTFVVNGKMIIKTRKVHQIVMEVFGPPRPTVHHIPCHKNDIRSDNRIKNLYWGTQRDNMLDVVKNDRHCKRISVVKARNIFRSSGFIMTIAKKFNVSRDVVQDIHKGRTYYDFTRGLKKGIIVKARSSEKRSPGCRYVFTDKLVEEIRIRTRHGESVAAVSRDLGVGHVNAYNAAVGNTYRWVRTPVLPKRDFHLCIKNLPEPLTKNPVRHEKAYDPTHSCPVVSQ